MSRQIKFHAWDKVNKCMKVVSEIDFLYEKPQKMTWGMQGVINDIWLNGEDESYIPCDVILLQYTELKDKNGLEIHDGHILKAWKHNETPFIHAVEYRNGIPWFGNWNWIEFQNIFRNIEIIGTVFENSELLGGKA